MPPFFWRMNACGFLRLLKNWKREKYLPSFANQTLVTGTYTRRIEWAEQSAQTAEQLSVYMYPEHRVVCSFARTIYLIEIQIIIFCWAPSSHIIIMRKRTSRKNIETKNPATRAAPQTQPNNNNGRNPWIKWLPQFSLVVEAATTTLCLDWCDPRQNLRR